MNMSVSSTHPEGKADRSSRRVLLFALLLWCTIIWFAWWYLSQASKDKNNRQNSAPHDDIERPLPLNQERFKNVTYPSMDLPPPPDQVSVFDPLNLVPLADLPHTAPVDLFSVLPSDASVVLLLDIDQFKKARWTHDVLKGQRLKLFHIAASLMGVDLWQTKRIAAALEIRSALAMDLAGLLRGWSQWRKALTQPLCVAALTNQERQSILRVFRKFGPLRATMLMGHRVYQRAYGFSLTLPFSGLLLATYHRPLSTLLSLATGRSKSSVRQQADRWLIAATNSPNGEVPAARVLSRLWDSRTGKIQPLSAPGNTKIHACGLVAHIRNEGMTLRWVVEMDTERSAKRLASRLRSYVQNLAKMRWVQRSRLRISLLRMEITSEKNQLKAEMNVTAATCKGLLDWIQSR